MTPAIEELIVQQHDLERQIREAQKKAKAEAVARIRQVMSDFGLTVADIAPSMRRTAPHSGLKVPPKYIHPVSGLTWSGRGHKPTWLATALAEGKSLQDFAIKTSRE
jgi:DNA-binding protein H-NS